MSFGRVGLKASLQFICRGQCIGAAARARLLILRIPALDEDYRPDRGQLAWHAFIPLVAFDSEEGRGRGM